MRIVLAYLIDQETMTRACRDPVQVKARRFDGVRWQKEKEGANSRTSLLLHGLARRILDEVLAAEDCFGLHHHVVITPIEGRCCRRNTSCSR